MIINSKINAGFKKIRLLVNPGKLLSKFPILVTRICKRIESILWYPVSIYSRSNKRIFHDLIGTNLQYVDDVVILGHSVRLPSHDNQYVPLSNSADNEFKIFDSIKKYPIWRREIKDKRNPICLPWISSPCYNYYHFILDWVIPWLNTYRTLRLLDD